MNIASLQLLAREAGLKEFDHVKSEIHIIRGIQKQRQQEPCFATDKRYACSEECEWRASCRRLRAVWVR
jgi:hypothetical protein